MPSAWCRLFVSLTLGWLTTTAALAGTGPGADLSLEGTTLRGTVRVPRGQSLFANYRCSYVGWDVPFLAVTIPADFPMEICTIEFECNVTVDELGLAVTRRWHAVAPENFMLLGSPKGDNLVRGPRYPERPPEAYQSTSARLLTSVYAGDQRTPVAEWVIKYNNGHYNDSVQLDLWINADVKLLDANFFLPPDGLTAIQRDPTYFRTLGWKRTGGFQ